MQAITESKITYQDIFNRALLLLNRSEKAKKDQIIANFQLGELVAEVQDNASYGDAAVVKLAEDLTRAKGYQIHPAFLWGCARVYRTFKGNLQRVWKLEKELQLRGIQLSWRFLVRNCTPIPEPEKVLEAEAYWERQITEWENTVQEIEEKVEKKEEVLESMPPLAKKQFEGFVVRVAGDSAVKVKLNNFEKINNILNKMEILLDSLLSEKRYLREEIVNQLRSIKGKIETLLNLNNVM
ncbi:MAG: hypothetical protein QXV73_05075 [Candidatus Micrarchaeia archaeon]